MTDREKFEAWYWDNFGKFEDIEMSELFAIEEGDYYFLGPRMCRHAWHAALASQQPADDGWIEWAGGGCPVDEDALVDTKWSDGDQIHNRAGVFCWHKSDYATNIIAYRVVKP